jgi:hypothetical protein
MTTPPASTAPNSNKPIDEHFTLQYPLGKKLSSEDYLLIEILEYIAPGLNASSSEMLSFDIAEGNSKYTEDKIVIKKQISLPIPSGITDSNGVGWASGDINPFSAKLLSGNPLTDAGTAKNIVTEAFGSFSNLGAGLGEIMEKSTAKGQNLAATSLLVSNITGQPDLQKAIARQNGAIFNQNVELLFNSVNLRQPFTFAFTLAPRNVKESLYVKAIIKAFKKYMAPRRKTKDSVNGLLIKAPHVFKLRYMHGKDEHPFLHKFKICALTSMNVNYTGSNVYSTYPDGTPVHIEMSLVFQELSPIYFDDYENLDNNTQPRNFGVGY